MQRSTRSSAPFLPLEAPLIFDFAEEESRRVIEEVLRSFALETNEPTTPHRDNNSTEIPISWFGRLYQSFRQQSTMRSVAVFLLIYVIIVTFDSLMRSDGRLLRRAASPPRPFFPQTSKGFLVDYYTGSGAHPTVLLQRSELVVVMYYAPWSFESKQSRIMFEQLASSLSFNTDVSFAAVNCFFSLGQCRNTYKAHAFPIIVAYVGRLAVMYNGELFVDYLHRWVLRLRSPVKRLYHLSQVERFVLENDNAVIGYFSFKNPFSMNWRYRQFIVAAIFAAQYERLFDRVEFAVVTNSDLAYRLNFSWEGQIVMHQWNRTVEYSYKRNYTGQAIAEWVRDEAVSSSLTQWIVPDAVSVMSSEQLYSVLKSGPVAILFTSREPLYPHKSDISVFEQTAMEYLSCGEQITARFQQMANVREQLRRERTARMFYDRHACAKVSPSSLQLKKCCNSVKGQLRSECRVCRAVQTGEQQSCRRENVLNTYSRRERAFHSASCQPSRSWLSTEELLSECCFLAAEDEQRAVDDFTRCGVHHLSRYLLYDHRSSSRDFMGPFERDSLAGLSCNRNNSLRFVAMDKRYYGFLLQKLGIPPEDGSKLIISDSVSEQTYLLQKPFSRHSLREFLRSFHDGVLSRHCVSEEDRGSVYVPSERVNITESVDEDVTVVQSTSAARFRDHILNGSTGEDVVLLFSGGSWHGPSAALFYVYHTVAHYFRRFAHSIKFFMIDMSRNEVPWNFKMERLPTLLFFPAKRKCGSTRFPGTVPFTVPNVIAFVLARCQPELRWRVALSSCSPSCIRQNTVRLRQHERLLRSELTVLHLLSVSFNSKRHSLLVDSLIRRRGAQLRVTRRILKLMFTLEGLSQSQLFREATRFVDDAALLQSMLETPLTIDLSS